MKNSDPRLAGLALHNAAALHAALEFCAANRIGSFRISSSILPLKTHPTVVDAIDELPGADEIVSAFRCCGELARDRYIPIRCPNSPHPGIVSRSIADIESQSEIAEWMRADTANIHAGGVYGDKRTALDAFRRNLGLLSEFARPRLTVENDDRNYTPADLLPICRSENLPLVYDVHHHHRCCADGLSIRQASTAARETWRWREPLFHLSNPIAGWKAPHPERHRDYIDLADFPKEWLKFAVTVEVEAKAKELAVAHLAKGLAKSSLARTSQLMRTIAPTVTDRPAGFESTSC
ncbi:MAG: UV DNA damage repair endonuclease UvsE [Verrucomicrobiota bacterium]|nr:UV DNA damage repair endonuclease UvsE [Verrucomicrobiota bacterium]